MQESFNYIRKSLTGIYSPNEISGISYLLLSEITGFTRTEIILNKNTIISDNQRKKLQSFVGRLLEHVPVQYVIGYTWFYGLRINVDENVLIPRPETEELVDWIRSSVKTTEPLKILDIGTGSGCISIALKSVLPDAEVTAYDISEGALNLAALNAEINKCHVNFQMQDVLTLNELPVKYNIIVSNPPYIPDAEKAEIEPHVLDHEPHTALFVPDNDPLLFYRKIAQLANNGLCSGGGLFFEIHRDFGQQIMVMLNEMGYVNVELKNDIFNNPRMVKAEKN